MKSSGILRRLRETKTNAVNMEETYGQLQDYFGLPCMFADALHSPELYPELKHCQYMGIISPEYHKNH